MQDGRISVKVPASDLHQLTRQCAGSPSNTRRMLNQISCESRSFLRSRAPRLAMPGVQNMPTPGWAMMGMKKRNLLLVTVLRS